MANRAWTRVISVPYVASWDQDPYWRLTLYDIPNGTAEAVSLDHVRPLCAGYEPEPPFVRRLPLIDQFGKRRARLVRKGDFWYTVELD